MPSGSAALPTRSRARRARAATALAVLAAAGAGALLPASAAAATPELVAGGPTPTAPVRINFQPAGAPVPSGYTADSGRPFAGTSGWTDTAGRPLDLTANTRDRDSATAPDQRYDTFIHLQAPAGSGTTTPGRYRYALPKGTYDVRAVVGDPGDVITSVHRINAESGTGRAVTVIGGYRPTAAAPWRDATARVSVTDGFLDLDADGGTNTKLDLLEIYAVPAGTKPALRVASPDNPLLGLAHPRLLFSSTAGAATAARSVAVTNRGRAALLVSDIRLTGTDADSYRLDPSQPRSIAVASGETAQVKVLFTPTTPTGCPTSASPNPISDVERYATLALTSNDGAATNSTVDLAGLNACGVEGGNEPVLAQMSRVLGYTTQIPDSPADVRFLGPTRSLSYSDELQVPYFRRSNASLPVTLTPLAQYTGRDVTTGTFGGTGWYARSAAVKTPCASSDGCTRLFTFPGDSASPGPYTQNQKLLPVPIGTTTFSPTGPFGLFNGDGVGVNFTDDAKNSAITSTGAAITPPHYLHDLRVYPAYGPGHVRIAGTWLIGTDITRVPSYKNNDYQDVVLVLRNAVIDTPVAAQPSAPGTTLDLTAGGTVSAGCKVTGFTGVLPNTAGTQCDAPDLHFTGQGLSLTSTPGQLGGSVNSQRNALFKTFDASRTAFTVKARIVGPVGYLTQDYQQAAAFFGPDQDNYVKVEVEHNSSGADPHVSMFYEEGGVGTTVQTVSLPALTSASTVDLIVQGNTKVPDPLTAGSDPNGVRNYPLDEVKVSYSLNGAAPVPLGSVQRPADVMRWFSTSARAGILVSGGGSATPFTTTFSRFSVTAG